MAIYGQYFPGQVTLCDPTQYAYLPKDASSRRDRLLLFIPGTIALPAYYDEICKAGARNGYYAFAVAYSNLSPIELQGGVFADDNTVKNILDEYLTGNNVSPNVSVLRANSFENRIIKMISYMNSKYPSENWKRFLTDRNEIRWDKISVGGHSQGSDHAMYWSKVRALNRAGFFAGPGGFEFSNNRTPTFIQKPGLTPYANLYGFNHTVDDLRPWSGVKKVWAILGIPGVPTSVDNGTIGNSHQLFTSKSGGSGHNTIVLDDATPINPATGKPFAEFVWQYMLFP